MIDSFIIAKIPACFAPVAQRIEQFPSKEKAGGSTPSWGAMLYMDKYIFLGISVGLAPIWIFLFYKRIDLRKRIIYTSLVGGIVGIISEYWYFRDYWQPPTVVQNFPYIEDFIFGFFIVGITLSISHFLFRTIPVKSIKTYKKITLAMFLVNFVLLIILNNVFGLNSIYVSSILFIATATIILFIRKDLLKNAVATSFFVLTIITLIYLILFDVISPNYWDKYWMLASTKLGYTILGNIPVTEAIWYASWGLLGGTVFDFTFGNKPEKLVQLNND